MAVFRKNWQVEKLTVDGRRGRRYSDNPCIHTAPPSPRAALQSVKEEPEIMAVAPTSARAPPFATLDERTNDEFITVNTARSYTVTLPPSSTALQFTKIELAIDSWAPMPETCSPDDVETLLLHVTVTCVIVIPVQPEPVEQEIWLSVRRLIVLGEVGWPTMVSEQGSHGSVQRATWKSHTELLVTRIESES
jgi:hypothetical protein